MFYYPPPPPTPCKEVDYATFMGVKGKEWSRYRVEEGVKVRRTMESGIGECFMLRVGEEGLSYYPDLWEWWTAVKSGWKREKEEREAMGWWEKTLKWFSHRN